MFATGGLAERGHQEEGDHCPRDDLALIYLKARVGYLHGFQGLYWESGFFSSEASLRGRFLHFFSAIVVDLGDSIQTHLSSGVDPTAAAQAE